MPNNTPMPAGLSNEVSEAASGMVTNISSSLQNTLDQLWTNALELVPNIVAMLVILFVGYFVSRFVAWLAKMILSKLQLDPLCDRIGLHDVTHSLGIQMPFSRIVSTLIFWAGMLMFLVAAVDALGMNSVSNSIGSLLGYVPNIVGATVIVIFGLVLANFVKTMVQSAAARMDLENGSTVGQLVYGVLIILIGSLALGQLHLQTALVDRVIEIALMAVAAGLAIALGFGTRDIAKQVVAGIYARESFPTGTTITFDGKSGTIQAVRSVNTAIDVGEEIIVIPNAELMESKVAVKAKSR